MHQRHVVRHPLHLVEQVRREDHRAPVIGHGADDGIEDVAADHRVEAGGGLVQNQQLWTMGHGGDQAGLGTHALRELLDLLGRIQRERLEQLARIRRIPCRMEGLRVAHQLVDAHPLRQLAFLGEVADAAQHTDRVAHRVEAEDAHRAGGGAQQAEQVLEERRLAGAVGTDEAVDLARAGVE